MVWWSRRLIATLGNHTIKAELQETVREAPRRRGRRGRGVAVGTVNGLSGRAVDGHCRRRLLLPGKGWVGVDGGSEDEELVQLVQHGYGCKVAKQGWIRSVEWSMDKVIPLSS